MESGATVSWGQVTSEVVIEGAGNPGKIKSEVMIEIFVFRGESCLDEVRREVS